MSAPVTENRIYDITIDGVNINKKALDLLPVDTLGELQALNIFAHRSGQTKTDDEAEVMARVGSFNGTFKTDDISLAHTNGSIATTFAISNALKSGSFGAAIGGNGVFAPTNGADHCITMDTLARIKGMKVYTNIVANDAGSDFDPGAIVCWYSQAYQTAIDAATSGQRLTLNFYQTAGNFNSNPNHTQTHAVTGGTLSSPPNIGDTGTQYGEVVLANDYSFLTDKQMMVGYNAEFKNQYYIIFGIQIPASAVTKTFKFRFELDYEVI